MEILQGPPWRTINSEKIISPATSCLHHSYTKSLIYCGYFFSAPMAATELLCSSLGEQAKHWGQVEHAQFCKASKGSGLGFVFVWGKSCSLHMVTTVRHKQTWGSKPHHAHAAFPDTNWRESGKEKEIYHSYTIYPLAVWLFFSPYCKFWQKSNCSDERKKTKSKASQICRRLFCADRSKWS